MAANEEILQALIAIRDAFDDYRQSRSKTCSDLRAISSELRATYSQIPIQQPPVEVEGIVQEKVEPDFGIDDDDEDIRVDSPERLEPNADDVWLEVLEENLKAFGEMPARSTPIVITSAAQSESTTDLASRDGGVRTTASEIKNDEGIMSDSDFDDYVEKNAAEKSRSTVGNGGLPEVDNYVNRIGSTTNTAQVFDDMSVNINNEEQGSDSEFLMFNEMPGKNLTTVEELIEQHKMLDEKPTRWGSRFHDERVQLFNEANLDRELVTFNFMGATKSAPSWVVRVTRFKGGTYFRPYSLTIELPSFGCTFGAHGTNETHELYVDVDCECVCTGMGNELLNVLGTHVIVEEMVEQNRMQEIDKPVIIDRNPLMSKFHLVEAVKCDVWYNARHCETTEAQDLGHSLFFGKAIKKSLQSWVEMATRFERCTDFILHSQNLAIFGTEMSNGNEYARIGLARLSVHDFPSIDASVLHKSSCVSCPNGLNIHHKRWDSDDREFQKIGSVLCVADYGNDLNLYATIEPNELEKDIGEYVGQEFTAYGSSKLLGSFCLAFIVSRFEIGHRTPKSWVAVVTFFKGGGVNGNSDLLKYVEFFGNCWEHYDFDFLLLVERKEKQDCTHTVANVVVFLVDDYINSDDEKVNIESIFWSAMDMLSGDDKKLPQVSNRLPLLKRGIGVHHSGLLPLLMEVIETLFQEGLIKCLFTTETFSIGLNMPAKTVVFTNVRKFDGDKFRWISSGEYIQKCGHASRHFVETKNLVPSWVDIVTIFKGGTGCEDNYVLTGILAPLRQNVPETPGSSRTKLKNSMSHQVSWKRALLAKQVESPTSWAVLTSGFEGGGTSVTDSLILVKYQAHRSFYFRSSKFTCFLLLHFC